MSVQKSSLIATLHDRISGPAKNARGELGRLNRAGRGFGATQARISAPVLGATRNLVAMGAAYIGVREGYDQSIGGALRLETVMADVAKKTTLTAHELAGVEKQIIRLSNMKGGMAATEIGKLYAQAGQFGIANNELERFVVLGNKAGIAFDMAATETANSLSKLKNAFALDMPGLEGLADSINYTADSAGTSEKSLIDFLLRTAASAKTFGITGQEMAAFGATLNEIGIESSKAGTGMNAMMAKLAGLSKSKKAVAALDRFAGKGYSKELQAKFFETPVVAMKEFFQVVKKMDAQSRSGLLIDFFGLEYQDDAAAIANNIDKIVGRLEKLGDASKYVGSVDRTFEIFANTSEEKLKRLGRVFSNLGAQFGANVLPPITDFAEKLSDTFATLDSRVTVFDTIGAKAQGFVTGLGFTGDTNVADAFNSMWDSVFGRADELTSDVERMGASFEKFRQMGADLRSFGADVGWAVGEIEVFFGLDPGSAGTLVTSLAGWGATLGAAAVGFALIAGSVRAVGKAVLFLSGIKPAWGLLRFLGRLVKLGGSAASVAALASATGALGKSAKDLPQKAAGAPGGKHKPVGKPGATAPGKGASGPRLMGWGGVLSLWNAYQLIDSIPQNEQDLLAFVKQGQGRGDAFNGWLESTVGSPKSWLKSLTGPDLGPVQGPPTRPDAAQQLIDKKETDARFHPMKPFNVLGDLEKRLNANGDQSGNSGVKLLGTPPVKLSGEPVVTTKPSGVQEVRVTNPNPPQINMDISVVVHEASNADAIVQQLGSQMKQEMQGLQADFETAGP
ncbi:phage tail tape measure protein [Roseibium alexandrii]|uniref:Phage tail tape measure protein, TP901 family, core region n=1 Tax=Roseibium alexandrii (strain DSM 17067 / NCIMB 14079 / DFL-11) TaxID=244592 RepID=A0A5E8GW79_ROSAD|nr:phage tail tape measure protein [Roseibium alexandrii]EEE43196.1 phage tail tape measure protein, TP901 family, core region [Roseibium alexandrii DFL-11]